MTSGQQCAAPDRRLERATLSASAGLGTTCVRRARPGADQCGGPICTRVVLAPGHGVREGPAGARTPRAPWASSMQPPLGVTAPLGRGGSVTRRPRWPEAQRRRAGWCSLACWCHRSPASAGQCLLRALLQPWGFPRPLWNPLSGPEAAGELGGRGAGALGWGSQEGTEGTGARGLDTGLEALAHGT